MKCLAVIATLAASVSAVAMPQGGLRSCTWSGDSCEQSVSGSCCPDLFCVFPNREAEKAGKKTCHADVYAFKLGFGPFDPNDCNKGQFCIIPEECCLGHTCKAYDGETQTYCIQDSPVDPPAPAGNH